MVVQKFTKLGSFDQHMARRCKKNIFGLNPWGLGQGQNVKYQNMQLQAHSKTCKSGDGDGSRAMYTVRLFYFLTFEGTPRANRRESEKT